MKAAQTCPQKRKQQKQKKQNEEGRAFRVHPLFLLAGAYACFHRSLPLYLGAVLVALEHECAHSFAAARLGFRLNRVVLMPYGAVISGNLDGISFKDEIRVAAAALAARGKGAFSLFVSAAFLCFGAFSGGGRYEKIQPDYTAAFSRGTEIKRAAADGSMTLKRALSLCESGKYLILEVYSDGEKAFEAEERDLYNAVSGENLYLPLSEIFKKRKKCEKEANIACKV